MGYEANKTEHCGPKRGKGAYWGYKWEAKKESIKPNPPRKRQARGPRRNQRRYLR
jgi:hypothetical protein